MPTPGERRALIFIAVIAALGVAVRGFRELRSDPPVAGDSAGLARQIEAVDSAIAVSGTKRGRGAHGGRSTVAKAGEQPGAVGPAAGQPVPPEWPPQARFPKEWIAPGQNDLVRADARRQHQAVSDSARPGAARRETATSRRWAVGADAAQCSLSVRLRQEIQALPRPRLRPLISAPAVPIAVTAPGIRARRYKYLIRG